MSEGPMTATEVVLRHKQFMEERMPEFERVFKKHFGDALDRLMRIIHTREVLGPAPGLMEDSWDLICVAMVLTTMVFLTGVFLHARGVL